MLVCLVLPPEQVMKEMEKNIRANDYRSILNFFKVISEVRLVEEELRNYVIKVLLSCVSFFILLFVVAGRQAGRRGQKRSACLRVLTLSRSPGLVQVQASCAPGSQANDGDA